MHVQELFSAGMVWYGKGHTPISLSFHKQFSNSGHSLYVSVNQPSSSSVTEKETFQQMKGPTERQGNLTVYTYAPQTEQSLRSRVAELYQLVSVQYSLPTILSQLNKYCFSPCSVSSIHTIPTILVHVQSVATYIYTH